MNVRTPKDLKEYSDKRKVLGVSGEDIAASYLQKKGHKLVERNFRCRLGEIDIITLSEDKICFVEVKTRKSLKYGLPCEAVTAGKQKHIRNTALFFLKSHHEYCRKEIRFHVVEVLKLESGTYIRLIENAF